MLTARRHRRANGATTFSLHINAPDTALDEDASQEPSCFAKLHASFMGTEYKLVLSDASVDTMAGMGAPGSCELGAVMYAPNIIGTKGPRKVTVVLPKLLPTAESSWELQTAWMEGSLIQR